MPTPQPVYNWCLPQDVSRLWSPEDEAMPTPPLQEGVTPAPPLATIACCRAPPAYCIPRGWTCPRSHTHRCLQLLALFLFRSHPRLHSIRGHFQALTPEGLSSLLR